MCHYVIFYCRFLVILLASSGLISCNEPDIAGCREGNCSTTYLEKSVLVEIQNQDWLQLEVADGDHVVFMYEYNYEDEEFIADDELTELLYFQIPSNQDEFTIEASSFETQKVYFNRICFCVKTGFEHPTSGTISGKKLAANQWEVSADLTINYYGPEEPIRLAFDHVFTRN
jgi:hypothetical protein